MLAVQMELLEKIERIVISSERLLNDSHKHFRESKSEDELRFHALKLQIIILQFEVSSEIEQIVRRRPSGFAAQVALKDVLHKIVEYDRTLRGSHIKKILDYAAMRGVSHVKAEIRKILKKWGNDLKTVDSFVTLRNKATAHYDSDINTQISAIEAIGSDTAIDVVFSFLSFNHEITGVLRDIVYNPGRFNETGD